MRNLTPIFALAMLLPVLAQPQTKYRIVVLGSSTAAGVGASSPDSSWVGRIKAYYRSLHELDTIINLAVPGSYSDSGVNLLPEAMDYHPDIVLVGFPSNDIIAGIPIHSFVNNLRKMYNTVTSAGKKCYVTTTQPRNDPYESLLRIGRDSIQHAFPVASVLNFYDPLVSPSSDDINPLYSTEGIHPNDAGHRLLAQVVVAANVVPISPLAITTTGFSAIRRGHTVVVDWKASGTDNNVDFFVARSADGTSYQDIYHVTATPAGTATQYTFTDQNPLPTNFFYRLRIVSDGNAITYSKTIQLTAITAAFSIKDLFVTPGRRGLSATIAIPNDQTVRLSIFTTSGTAIKQQSYSLKAPFTTMDVPLPALSAGLYILQITTSDGQHIVRTFPVLQ